MSNRPFIKPTPVITAGNMTGNLTSLPTLLPQLTRGTYEISWTGGGTPVGTITLEGSDSYVALPTGQVANAGVWTTMDVLVSGAVVSSIPVSGNSGSILIDWATGVNAIRVVYTAASGTATMTALINAKVG